MKSTRILMITIPLVVLIAGFVGFLITYPSSAQAAYARLFIDLGTIVALFFVTLTIPKAPPLRSSEIADALNELARGRFEKRLAAKEFPELAEIVPAFNHLAKTLTESKRDLETKSIRSTTVAKDQVERRPIVNEFQSLHSELGTVLPLPYEPKDMHSQESVKEDRVAETSVDHKKETLAPSEIVDPISESESLYEQFADAHREINQMVVDFEVFKSTIDRAREDLLSAHQCKSIRFEVVKEDGEVALRPRLVR